MNTQPENFNITLFKHQLVAISKMEERENKKNIDKFLETRLSIYADITGYGKTAALIGLIIRDKMEWDMHTDYILNSIRVYYGNNIIKHKSETVYQRINCTIIIANQSILPQWLDELGHSILRVAKITRRKHIIDIDPTKYDVIVISPTRFNQFSQKYSTYAWKRLIFDEPSHTKIPAMREMIAGFYWLVTATPELLRYNSKKFSKFLSFFPYITTPIFNSLIIKNNDDFVKESFSMPTTKHIFHECYQPIFNLLRSFISPGISEMISAGDIEGAVRTLGGTSCSNILKLVKKKKQESIDECILRLRIYSQRQGNYSQQIKFWTDKKLKYQRQIIELDAKFQNIIETGTCGICLENFKKPVLLSCCQNLFCGGCILKWLNQKNSCPLCRATINAQENIVYITKKNDNKPIKKQKSKLLTKLQVITNLIKNDEKRKFLIFSASAITFTLIRKKLEEEHITFVEIKGQCGTRTHNIQDFKDGKIRVIFLNSTNNGAGINLQEATDIILYHRMSESIENQIIGRANRIGRKYPLLIHHLI